MSNVEARARLHRFLSVTGQVIVMLAIVTFARLAVASADPVNFTFSGTLTDSNSQPIAGITVSLEDAGASGVTDASGNFSMSVPAGDYTYLDFSSSNATLGASTVANMDVGQAGDVNIDLSNSDVTQNFSLSLAQLTINSKNADSSNATGATTSFAVYNAGSSVVSSGGNTYSFADNTVAASGSVDSDGAYSFYVPAGTAYSVTYPNNLCVFFLDGVHTCSTNSFTVSTDTAIEVDEPAISQFSGTVTDTNGNPLSNLTVSILTDSGSGAGTAVTDANGNFAVIVPSGTYSYLQFSTSNSYVNGMRVADMSLGSAGDISLDLSGQNLTQNFTLDLVPLTIAVKDGDGTPDTAASASFATYNSAAATVSSNGTDYSFANTTTNFSNSTDGNGQVVVLVPRGTSYDGSYPSNLCAFYTDGSGTCTNSSFAAGDATTVAIVKDLQNPTGLSADSPAPQPALTWTGSDSAASYNVYRDGQNIGNTASASFTDTTATEGTHSYYVTAVNGSGQESTASNTITVDVP